MMIKAVISMINDRINVGICFEMIPIVHLNVTKQDGGEYLIC